MEIFSYWTLLGFFDQLYLFFQIILTVFNATLHDIVYGLTVSYLSPFTNEVVSIPLGIEAGLMSSIPDNFFGFLGINHIPLYSLLLGTSILVFVVVGLVKFFTDLIN